MSLRDRHPDLTSTSDPKQAITIVTQCVRIFWVPHLNSHLTSAIRWVVLEKEPGVLTVQRPLGGMAAFVTYSSSHGDPEGPQRPWGVHGETDHGWKT